MIIRSPFCDHHIYRFIFHYFFLFSLITFHNFILFAKIPPLTIYIDQFLYYSSTIVKPRYFFKIILTSKYVIYDITDVKIEA